MWQHLFWGWLTRSNHSVSFTFDSSVLTEMETSTVGYKEIFEAVRHGDAAKVADMIEADRSLIDVADSNQSTPLTVAFAYGQLGIAHLLIERGANAFAMNHSDRWPMRCIVEKDGLPTQEREQLTEAVIAAAAWDCEMFHAVWRRDHQHVEELLRSDDSLASTRLADSKGGDGFYNGLPYCGLTPLHYAVIAGDLPTVQLLLDAGAEVDALPHGHADDSRHTPLYFVPEGSEDIAELLVDHGADVRHSPAYLSEGSQAMRRVVVAHGAAGSPLMGALTIGDFETAVQIASSNPSVIHDRVVDASIDTPLHLAVKANCAEVVDLLLAHGMDVDTPSRRGFTALAMAAEMYADFDMFKLLVEHGADIHVGNDSPLYAAIWQHAYGHWDYEQVIRYLAQRGSKPRGMCECARGGNLALAQLLVELGADVNETDEFGFYSKRIPNAKGCTALDYCTGVAGKHSHPDIAKLLREHGGRHAADLS